MELGKPSGIFTEIWQDSFSPCENSAKISLEPHEIPEGDSRSFLMGSYIWVLWMKKITIGAIENELLKLKLNYNIVKLFKILKQSFWHGKQLMKTSSIWSNIFQKPFTTGAPPLTPLRELKPPRSHIADCIAPLTPRSDSIGVGTFDCCPIW